MATQQLSQTNQVSPEYIEIMNRIEKELDEVYEMEDGEQFCFQLSNEIVRIGLNIIEERHFERESVYYTVDDCMEKMFTILDVSSLNNIEKKHLGVNHHMIQYTFIQKDEGDGEMALHHLEEGSPLEPSIEPQRIPNDSCARGSVPMRRKPQPPPMSRANSGRLSKTSIRSFGQGPRASVAVNNTKDAINTSTSTAKSTTIRSSMASSILSTVTNKQNANRPMNGATSVVR
ncbi:hypothetical protein C9374_002720 [Naegleria lovaniensis]|uniref:Uncharacterized protein n=1 Tax=Naegleria lovaniensis TaxID=51637 RepID=A0AA88KLX0_NAELO|nr:uncharacterized protein C9374_002720 [Naegleria lovaniensis]KAG2386274.1 hypothetical protein C9374_002720 [Naegleria lovaniensis]